MSRRVNLEQRQKLFAFMVAHEDLARGRVSGPDAARLKQARLQELANELNSLGSGATKSPEKWYKCWQDWKSDVKAKYLKIKKARSGTGGGPSPAPLSALEENLLQFFGLEMVEGLPEVPDPLQSAEETHPDPAIEREEEVPYVAVEVVNVNPAEEVPSTRQKNDPLNNILERQAAAIEDVAAAIREMAAALQQIAIALQSTQP